MSRNPRRGVHLALGAIALSLASCRGPEPAPSRPAPPMPAPAPTQATAPTLATAEGPQATASSGQESTVWPGTAVSPERPDPFKSERLLIYRLDVGKRRFTSSSWDPVADPLVIAAGLIYEPDYWPVGLETGVSYSTDSGIQNGSGYQSTNFELYGGINRSFWPVRKKLVWTFGAGLSLNFTKERLDVFTPPLFINEVRGSDNWLAAYLHTRLGWMFTEYFDIGVDLRGMTGQDVSTIGPVKTSDNFQVLFGIGIHR